MNSFISAFSLIVICECSFGQLLNINLGGVAAVVDDCKDLEPGKYPGGDCDTYVVCTGKKGSGEKGPATLCGPGTKFEKYQRDCLPMDQVDCEWCRTEDDYAEDPTSKAHFFGCVGPKAMLYPQRFKCVKGDYDHKNKKCGGTKGDKMDLKVDATCDEPKDKKVLAEEARKKKPEGRCPPCGCTDKSCSSTTAESSTTPKNGGS